MLRNDQGYERIERHPIDLEDVIKELRERVAEAQEDKYPIRPISYALYHLWREIDAVEENRR